jgi:hypothetical protein
MKHAKVHHLLDPARIEREEEVHRHDKDFCYLQRLGSTGMSEVSSLSSQFWSRGKPRENADDEVVTGPGESAQHSPLPTELVLPAVGIFTVPAVFLSGPKQHRSLPLIKCMPRWFQQSPRCFRVFFILCTLLMLTAGCIIVAATLLLQDKESSSTSDIDFLAELNSQGGDRTPSPSTFPMIPDDDPFGDQGIPRFPSIGLVPTDAPSLAPETLQDTSTMPVPGRRAPTLEPTSLPPTGSPTQATIARTITGAPVTPTDVPTVVVLTEAPTFVVVTGTPIAPTTPPSRRPTPVPTLPPTTPPTRQPTVRPTRHPTQRPTAGPSPGAIVVEETAVIQMATASPTRGMDAKMKMAMDDGMDNGMDNGMDKMAMMRRRRRH